MTTERLEEIFTDYSNAGDVRQYSGRAMDGAQCVGVYYESLRDALVDLADIAIGLTMETPDDAEVYLEALKRLNFDDLGQGMILYFPKFKYSDASAA